jgi:O-antigen/teichoic acid export membrane protein
MIRPVIGTVAARVVITAMNLLVIMAAGQLLGAEGLGTISLVVLGITFVLLLSHVVGGGGLVYLVPRYGVRALLRPSYRWAILCAIVAWSIQQLAPIVPVELVDHVVALAFLQSLVSIHINILLGKERIGQLNLVLVAQSATQLLGFVVLMRVNGPSVLDYVHALYLAYGIAAVVSGGLVLSLMGAKSPTTEQGVLRAVFKQGGLAQGANLLQLLNYRLAYYLIEHFRGRSALGIFSVTTQLAESTWLIPKSIGGVLYSKVSNLGEAERQRDLTVILLKVSVGMALIGCLVLLALPDGIYSKVFGPEVVGLHPLLLAMSPGLLAMAASQVLSHYLSGTGRIKHNTVASGLGLLVTVVLGFLLIPGNGLMGAAITASAAYCTAVTHQLWVFMRYTGTRPREFWPHTGDGMRVAEIWKRWRGR